MSRVATNLFSGVTDPVCVSDQAVQTEKMARGLKFRIKEVNALHYLCKENKGTDSGSRASDLCLCFSICNKQVFS